MKVAEGSRMSLNKTIDDFLSSRFLKQNGEFVAVYSLNFPVSELLVKNSFAGLIVNRVGQAACKKF